MGWALHPGGHSIVAMVWAATAQTPVGQAYLLAATLGAKGEGRERKGKPQVRESL